MGVNFHEIMPTFQVPQFIEEKSKIAGPFTLSQLLYFAGAFGTSVLAWAVFNIVLWFFISAIAGAIAFALSFVKIEGQGLLVVILSGIGFFFKPKTYVWQREGEVELDKTEVNRLETLRRSAGMQEKLKSASVGVSTGIAPLLKDGKEEAPGEKYQVVTYLTGEQRLAKKVDFKE